MPVSEGGGSRQGRRVRLPPSAPISQDNRSKPPTPENGSHLDAIAEGHPLAAVGAMPSNHEKGRHREAKDVGKSGLSSSFLGWQKRLL